jgi:NADH-quinone oxidoreductase subunit N
VVSAVFGEADNGRTDRPGPPAGGELAAYRGMYREHPRAAVALAFFLLCLAGLPPGVMGLFAKVVVFKAAVGGDLVWLAVIMAINVVIALYYYLRWAAVLFDVSLFGAPQLTTPEGVSVPALPRAVPALAPRLAIGIAFALAVVFSFWPNPALDAITFRW